MLKNEAGRWLAKGQNSGYGDLSMIYRVSQNEFLLKSFTPKFLWLLILNSGLQGCLSEEINVVKIQFRKKKFCWGHSVDLAKSPDLEILPLDNPLCDSF